MTDANRSDNGVNATVKPDSGTPLVETVVDELPRGRALDVATGEGRAALTLAERGWSVDAIDISLTMLDRARDRAATRTCSIEWILADVDSYCFPDAIYDVVTIRFFDARDRLDAIKSALAPGGVLVYEHHLQSESGSSERGPSSQYRFDTNELLDACRELRVQYYAEDPERSRVWLVASRPPA